MKTQLLRLVCFLTALLALADVARAQGTGFTYQGRLTENGASFNGSAEFLATLWDTAGGGTPLLTNSPALVIVSVTNGLFVLPLNFGGAPFTAGAARWLQLEMRTAIGGFSLLSPRQKLTATPYALVAGNVTGPVAASQLAGSLPSANLGGSYGGAVTFNNPANSFSGNGAALNSVNAATLNGVPSAGFWSTNGNAGANPTNGAFLGTRDNLPLELMVYSERVLRLEPHFISPNVIAGSRRNGVSNGSFGATIVGGGSSDYPNRTAGEYATVLGGYGNTANGRASAAMGFNTTAGGNFSTAAGVDARASGNSSVAMGNSITASGAYASALGNGNTASGEAATALGWGTAASALGATALGVATEASGERSLASGFLSVASGFCSTALGRGNVAGGEYSFAAGYRAKANQPGSFVWADSIGLDFASTDQNQFVIRATGGVGIGTGRPQANLHVYGENNPAVIRVQSAGAPGFGRVEFVSDPQGSGSEWRPGYIQSADNGGFTGGLAFVVNGTTFDNRFGEVETMRIVNGRVGIGTTTPVSALQVVGTVTATAFNPPSDRNLKENFAPVSPREVLEKVACLPISRWNFKGDTATPHVGPMAQDFHAAFGLGTDERHIATVDADGVALAAIQGLNEKVDAAVVRLRSDNEALKKQNEDLLRRLSDLEAKFR